MSKPKGMTEKGDEQNHKVKRRKIDHKDAGDFSKGIPHTLRDLQKALTFQQDSSAELRNGIRLFKNLLDSILYDEQNPAKAKQISILKNYCEIQSAQDGRRGIVSPFPDILQTWSFAEQSNNDALLSSVPAVLALFLKTVSSELDFRNFGVALCKSLLQSEQLVLFNRGLSAAKTKEHLISPCIRLLTEIVSFDGGAVAATLFAKHETTFKRLDVFLSMRKELSGDPEEDRRKPSVRNNAVRYLLANLRFQAVTAKSDLLSQGMLWGMVLNDIRADTRDLVIDILVYLEKNVMKNPQITRAIKGKFFNQWNLSKIGALYAYKRELELKKDEKTVAELVNVFLLSACTDPDNGVVYPQTSWYPPGSHPDAPDPVEEKDSLIDLGLDSPSYVDSYREKVPVRNVTLSQFIQGLRPETDTLQMKLLLAIFEAAPELVADYFSKRPKSISDPKETPAWLGQSAFLFSTIQLPVPKYGGWRDGLPYMPPATSIVIENVLPRPLTSKILTRCLNQTSDVITLYGLSVVRRSLQKLAQVLEVYRSASSPSSRLWQQAASRLMTEFCRRCPTMKDVISAFRTTSKENFSQREAVLEIMVLYYEILPPIALEEKFDVSLSLVQVLESLKKPELVEEEKDSMLAQLNYILEIARHSPSVRWWHKPESLSLSPFSTVLEVLTDRQHDPNLNRIKALIDSIIVENGLVSNTNLSREAFFASFQSEKSWSPSHATFAFVDNCVMRLTQKPVYYLDLVHDMQNKTKVTGVVSVLFAVMAEQWPFVVKAGNGDDEEDVATWTARYLGYSKHAGEDEALLSSIRDQMADATSNKKSTSAFKKAFQHTHPEKLNIMNLHEAEKAKPLTEAKSNQRPVPTSLEDIYGVVPKAHMSSKGLTRLSGCDEVEEAVLQGYVGDLAMFFCSEREELRTSAYLNARNFMAHRLEQSAYSEAKPVYLLLGEVAETVKSASFIQMPYIFGELAARSALVLANPLHKMYGKINKYLNKGPKWDWRRIPSYWIDRVFLREPEHNDGYHAEIDWLLDLLINGLRMEDDMELYRQCNVFERCLSFYESPGLSRDTRKKIIHLVYRASEVGGSTTLITRAGIISWIQAQIVMGDGHDVILGQVMRHLVDSCDRERVEKWGGKALVEAMKQMRIEWK